MSNSEADLFGRFIETDNTKLSNYLNQFRSKSNYARHIVRWWMELEINEMQLLE